MSRRLIVDDGHHERELLLVDRIVVGRDPSCDLSDGDSLLSRRHAEFVGNDQHVLVRDLGSRNGTFINGIKVAEGMLQTGDLIQIGHFRVKFIQDAAPLAAVTEAVDVDATVMIAPAKRLPESSAPLPVVGPSDAGLQEADNDKTRLMSSPSLKQAVAAIKQSPAPVEENIPALDDELPEDAMKFSAKSSPAPAEPEKIPAPSNSRPSAAVGHLYAAVLTVIVFVSVAVALIVRQQRIGSGAAQATGDLIKSLAVPLVIVVAATYVVGTMINRKAMRAKTSSEEQTKS